MTDTMSPVETAVLTLMQDGQRRTVRELQQMTRHEYSSVHAAVQYLTRRGYLERSGGSAFGSGAGYVRGERSAYDGEPAGATQLRGPDGARVDVIAAPHQLDQITTALRPLGFSALQIARAGR